MRKGITVNFRGSWGSGLGYLDIEDSETKQVEAVPCDNASTVRALEAAFGNVITPGHTANGPGYKGQEIYWDYDEIGLVLGGFSPVDQASDELVEAYNNK